VCGTPQGKQIVNYAVSSFFNKNNLRENCKLLLEDTSWFII